MPLTLVELATMTKERYIYKSATTLNSLVVRFTICWRYEGVKNNIIQYVHVIVANRNPDKNEIYLLLKNTLTVLKPFFHNLFYFYST